MKFEKIFKFQSFTSTHPLTHSLTHSLTVSHNQSAFNQSAFNRPRIRPQPTQLTLLSSFVPSFLSCLRPLAWAAWAITSPSLLRCCVVAVVVVAHRSLTFVRACIRSFVDSFVRSFVRCHANFHVSSVIWHLASFICHLASGIWHLACD